MSHIGLIIGRFQPLHTGHKLLIESSIQNHSTTLVFIGSSNICNMNNPYSYESRRNIIEKNFSSHNLIIHALPDFQSDIEWGEYILKNLPKNIDSITLYCGDKENDSAVHSLMQIQRIFPCDIKVMEIPRSIIDISATQIREWIDTGNRKHLKKYLGETTLSLLDL